MFVVVRMPDGSSHRLEALEGWRVMEVIRDWGLPIKAECGGACACATCHVWVDEAWVAKLPAPTDEELEMLDGAFHVDERSRLCCQIIMAPELDGLEVELAPESLADAPPFSALRWDLEKDADLSHLRQRRAEAASGDGRRRACRDQDAAAA